jgi:hypothetical protein
MRLVPYALLLGLGLLGGCSYKVRLRSLPSPAVVVLPDGSQLSTPGTAVLRYQPFNHQWVEVSSPGYRTLRVDLRRREIRLGRILGQSLFHSQVLRGEPRSEVVFVLVPEHGPVGTWGSGDLPEP